MQLLCRSDSNSMPNVRHVAGVPDHRASKKHTNEGVGNVRTVTSRLHSGEGITRAGAQDVYSCEKGQKV